MDVFGVTYLIENAQQFWSELEDILRIPHDVTLSQLDATLRRYIQLAAAYHEQYLQSPLQMEHACQLLLESELFKFHSERMCELLLDDTQSHTDPHCQFILYNILLVYGRRNSSFLRSHKRWQPLIPLFMDHILIDIDPDVEDTYSGNSAPSGSRSLVIPIEVKLRSMSVRLLYEVCRVQKLSVQDLRVFDDKFIDRLFDLVEETRNMQDETFNYSVIKLIVALNEQFMVASLSPPDKAQAFHHDGPKPETQNRVLQLVMRRLGSCMTFGENLIFMLNRAGRTSEDRCMQLLVLKILYLLFTTKGTSEYFYTNDLCVLVDVFLRELVDLEEDQENESLRHTFLRVLHPLLTKTQLRTVPYKRPQIVRALESLIENADIRNVNPTTKRLVERCLSGEWCVQFRKTSGESKSKTRLGHLDLGPDHRVDSPSNDHVAAAGTSAMSPSTPHGFLGHGEKERTRGKTLKSSRSVENMKAAGASAPVPASRNLANLKGKPANESSSSLPLVAAARPSVAAPKRRDTASSLENSDTSMSVEWSSAREHRADSLGALSSSLLTMADVASAVPSVVPTPMKKVESHRSAPPTPPPRRRKPPAVPVGRTNGGATITAIASSASQPAMAHSHRAVT
ncbi:hypothetical protein NEOLEDRAFT_1132760 [Neolentinus lepideus HHB14362 ss-1]|uniref:SPIN90/Ldb17 leucine-rich domain-containing protein n=1 Tax=Neolentinus lepideus HHB14362 ss-1 TaxID=1314782 RepID=A0A165T5T0_9AGAM|nr:hypothetical protein NEOLEDRAFT_1132760 [Neolentinus lepideus HHB14362 ss-1]